MVLKATSNHASGVPVRVGVPASYCCKEIERQENVRIIRAVESGSRAWGFASPDSDYDVRFIYVRRTEDYLVLNEKRDVIEWLLDETLDINGWDVKKALQQACKGNAVLFEWAQSPIVYRTSEEWDFLWSVITGYFDARTFVGHYYGTALNTWKEYLTGETVRYKKYFYALRPLLACRYIEAYNSAPPMEFEKLRPMLPAKLEEAVDHLLEIKRRTDESGRGEHIPAITEFIENELENQREILTSMVRDGSRSSEPLNEVFRSLILGVSSDDIVEKL